MKSVLEQMTSGTMQRKETAAAALTPVGFERPSPLPRTAAPFPNDHPVEVIESAVKAIRREVAYILQALDAIDATNGVPPEATNTLADVQRAAERAADIKHRVEPATPVIDLTPEAAAIVERLKGREQKATTFSDDPAMKRGLDGAWACPKHGLENVIDMESPKGRKYRRCMVTNCKQFEKE